ncbi:MAG: prepilin-type N-terminal cleavage/methylation domain-containing protein [Candidatus Moraniibacteriota bacterium]|nr:MAG: prepilin-type N-terminal cleavage/methylation domain-containing protein [Candidatus Moranbacteria bacterium]
MKVFRFKTFFLRKEKNKKGFSLMESLMVIFIAGIITSSFFAAFTQGNRLINESKKKVTASSLANERMEMLRNLNYDDIGVVGGIPQGVFPGNEFIEKSGTEYRIFTDIRYVDDIYDGKQGGDPEDLVNTDYKIATVSVLWGAEAENQKVQFSSFFVPPGLESDSGTGTLSINIIDSSGAGVPSANVTIQNIPENISFSTSTDAVGNVFLPGSPQSQQLYKIAVEKNAFESVSTYPPYPTTEFTPVDEHASVFEGGVSNKVILIDKLSDIHFIAKTASGEIVPDVEFSLTGGRVIGSRAGTEEKVFGYEEDISLGIDGETDVLNLSPGQYAVEISEDMLPRYHFLSVSTSVFGEENVFSLNSDTHETIEILFLDTQASSLLVSVQNEQDNLGISGANVRIESSDGIFSKEKLSDQYGNAFFSLEDGIVLGETYTIEVSLEEYVSMNKDIVIQENMLLEKFLLQRE